MKLLFRGNNKYNSNAMVFVFPGDSTDNSCYCQCDAEGQIE